ncbi:unnamed protein product [Hymenolepis diminuta]|uniref:Uncharacterized protein n=1 Tax=Hymenolepis diminuta TaxID=6216 RepID=A0A0R3SIF8_HYMDI|nr:unnamed protein product [Hymenolepis diminuta]
MRNFSQPARSVVKSTARRNVQARWRNVSSSFVEPSTMTVWLRRKHAWTEEKLTATRISSSVLKITPRIRHYSFTC